MKNEAARARKDRLTAANRLIKMSQHKPPVLTQPKIPKQATRRMVEPLQLHIEAALKVATT